MWGTISTFVLGLTGSVVARVMLSIGLGVVSYASLSVYTDNVVSHISSSYSDIDRKSVV